MDKRYMEFLKCLDRRNENKDKCKEIDGEIIERFQEEMTIMITDSSRFTSRTKKYGIIQFLSVLRETYHRLNEIIEGNGGTIVKEWADDIFAVFKNPTEALKCGLKMQKYLSDRNARVADPDQFTICMGISHGKILYLGEDVFGDAVNTASKLGEDIASSDEVLLCENSYKLLENNGEYAFEYIKGLEMSDVVFNYYKLDK